MTQEPLTREKAIAYYTELDRRIQVGAYSERSTEEYLNDTWPEDGIEESVHNLEQWASVQGLEFCWHHDSKTWSLEPIESWRQDSVDEARRAQARFQAMQEDE